MLYIKRSLMILVGLVSLMVAEALQVEVWLDKGNGAVYRQNESVSVLFKANKDCYVTVYGIDTEGYLNLLYPLSKSRNNYVRGGKTYSIPDDWDYPDLRASGQEGMVYIQALATTETQNIPDWPVYSRYFQDNQYRVLEDPYEAFQRLSNEISTIEPDPEFFDSKGAYFYVHEKVPYPRYLCFQCHPQRTVSPYTDVCPSFSVVIYDRWYLPPRFVYWDRYHDYYHDSYYSGYWFILNRDQHDHYYYGAKSYKSYPNLVVASKHSAEKGLAFRKEYKPIYNSYQKNITTLGKSYKSETGVTIKSKSETGLTKSSKTDQSNRLAEKNKDTQVIKKSEPDIDNSNRSPRFKSKNQDQTITPKIQGDQTDHNSGTIRPVPKNDSRLRNDPREQDNQPTIRSETESGTNQNNPTAPLYRRPQNRDYRINRATIQPSKDNPSRSSYRQSTRSDNQPSRSSYQPSVRPSAPAYQAPSSFSRPSSGNLNSGSSSHASSTPRMSAPSAPAKSSQNSSSSPSKRQK